MTENEQNGVQRCTADNVDTGTAPTDAVPTAGGQTGISGCADVGNPRSHTSVADWIRGTAEALGVPLLGHYPQNSLLSADPGAPVPLPPQFQPAKQGYLVQVTREELGLGPATVFPFWSLGVEGAEELAAARTARMAEAKARIAGTTARLALAHPALHPVIELHSPNEREECLGCDAGDYAETSPQWPCSTIELILEGLE